MSTRPADGTGPRADSRGAGAAPAPDDGRARARPRAVPLLTAAGVVAAAAAGFAAHGLVRDGAPPAVAAAVPVSVAPVVRTDLSARQEVPGTLGYQGSYTVASEAGDGIHTWPPATGAVVRRGQPLFAVSGQPVTLLYGALPAWRTFAAGMPPGPDVRQLQQNLAAFGFSPGPADGQFGWATEAAVGRWQQARGLTATGTVPLGAVAFLPGPLRVTALAQPLGAAVQPGASVLSGTSLTPGVQVWLPAGESAVGPGDPVLVTMPDGITTVPGRVTSVGSVAGPSGGSQGSGGGSGGNGASGAAGPGGASGTGDTIPVTVTIGAAIPAGLDQAPVQVAITAQRADGVLAVPVTALLAVPGGGYAVQAAGPRGRLIPVTTGLFDDASGLVAVTGTGLVPGLRVEVAQG